MHECAHPTCTAQVPYGVLACRAHWFALPMAVRNRVGWTWRRWRGDLAHVAALEEYEAAVAEAVTAWGARP